MKHFTGIVGVLVNNSCVRCLLFLLASWVGVWLFVCPSVWHFGCGCTIYLNGQRKSCLQPWRESLRTKSSTSVGANNEVNGQRNPRFMLAIFLWLIELCSHCSSTRCRGSHRYSYLYALQRVPSRAELSVYIDLHSICFHINDIKSRRIPLRGS